MKSLQEKLINLSGIINTSSIPKEHHFEIVTENLNQLKLKIDDPIIYQAIETIKQYEHKHFSDFGAVVALVSIKEGCIFDNKYGKKLSKNIALNAVNYLTSSIMSTKHSVQSGITETAEALAWKAAEDEIERNRSLVAPNSEIPNNAGTWEQSTWDAFTNTKLKILEFNVKIIRNLLKTKEKK